MTGRKPELDLNFFDMIDLGLAKPNPAYHILTLTQLLFTNFNIILLFLFS